MAAAGAAGRARAADPGALREGSKVWVRDRPRDRWKLGFVTCADPLRAEPIGWGVDFAWAEVEAWRVPVPRARPPAPPGPGAGSPAGALEDHAPWTAPRKGGPGLGGATDRQLKRGRLAGGRPRRAVRRIRRVPTCVLRAAPPTPADAEAAADALASRWARATADAPAEAKPDALRPVASRAADMRAKFLCRHTAALRKASLGALTPAPVHCDVMERFLEALDTYGESALVLGYHGTREDNLGSIFDRGFLLPGRYGVRVANGNAHGRGIYVAEEGAHTLSQHFLGGSSKMLVCGVIDSTLAPHEAARQDSSVWPKYTWRAGLLAHRAHRPSAAKAERARRRRASKQPALRGGVAFGAEDACVRHAGNAMVIFRPEHVAPLFVADGGNTVGAEFRAAAVPYDPRQFLQGDRAGGACNRADQPLRIGTRRCWNTERFSAVWLPGAAETTGHAIRAKRRLVCKARDMQRAAMRLDKACVRT